MSGYLLDTNVLSELRKGPRANAAVLEWFDSCDDDDIWTSVLVIGELRRGVELVRRRDANGSRALDRWLRRLRADYADRILPVTESIADRWGRMGLAQPIQPIDGLLAATSIEHGLTLVTRNTSHIAESGVSALNPFNEQGA